MRASVTGVFGRLQKAATLIAHARHVSVSYTRCIPRGRSLPSVTVKTAVIDEIVKQEDDVEKQLADNPSSSMS